MTDPNIKAMAVSYKLLSRATQKVWRSGMKMENKANVIEMNKMLFTPLLN